MGGGAPCSRGEGCVPSAWSPIKRPCLRVPKTRLSRRLNPQAPNFPSRASNPRRPWAKRDDQCGGVRSSSHVAGMGVEFALGGAGQQPQKASLVTHAVTALYSLQNALPGPRGTSP